MSPSTHSSQPVPDPFIDEVRALKRALSERFGHNLDRIAEHLRQIECSGTIAPVQPPKSEPRGKIA
jgi:hypothetical protein